ncbi:hypothetical protein Tco_0863354 [Tanacetum coccineum]
MSSRIDPILEEFAGELAHIAPIPPGIVEADFDPNDDTSSDDDDFEDIDILPTLVSDLPFISSIVSFENEDTIFDPGIVTFLRAGGIF